MKLKPKVFPKFTAKKRWESGGFALFYKRFERGTFELPGQGTPGRGQPLEYGH
jgi:hypothetical protein